MPESEPSSPLPTFAGFSAPCVPPEESGPEPSDDGLLGPSPLLDAPPLEDGLPGPSPPPTGPAPEGDWLGPLGAEDSPGALLGGDNGAPPDGLLGPSPPLALGEPPAGTGPFDDGPPLLPPGLGEPPVGAGPLDDGLPGPAPVWLGPEPLDDGAGAEGPPPEPEPVDVGAVGVGLDGPPGLSTDPGIPGGGVNSGMSGAGGASGKSGPFGVPPPSPRNGPGESGNALLNKFDVVLSPLAIEPVLDRAPPGTNNVPMLKTASLTPRTGFSP